MTSVVLLSGRFVVWLNVLFLCYNCKQPNNKTTKQLNNKTTYSIKKQKKGGKKASNWK